jgi:hypothetical protein
MAASKPYAGLPAPQRHHAANFAPGQPRVGDDIDFLQDQEHLMRLHTGLIAFQKPGLAGRLFGGMVLRILQ